MAANRAHGVQLVSISSINHLVLERHTFPLLRWMNRYAINGSMALYVGVQQSPHQWPCQMDLSLMRSLWRRFEPSSDSKCGENIWASSGIDI